MLIVMATLSTRLTQQVGAVDQHRVHPFADLHGRGTTQWTPKTASHNEAKSRTPLLYPLDVVDVGPVLVKSNRCLCVVVVKFDVDSVRRLGNMLLSREAPFCR